MTVTVRPAVFPDDAAAIAGLDLSFVVRQAYHVVVIEDDFRLLLRSLPKPLAKVYPLPDDLAQVVEHERLEGWVAEVDGKVAGFAASRFDPQTRRFAQRFLCVDQGARRHGIARALASTMEQRGREIGARQLWAETSTFNVPGVAAYRAMGFHLSGVDLTRYDGTAAQDEVALFFTRDIPLEEGRG